MPRLMRTVARTAVIAGTATAVSNRVSRRQAGRWAAQEQQAADAAYQEQPPAYAQPAPQAPDKVALLKELATLKDQGILTESEFATQKQKILAS
jgi:Short C-terminal domain